jgi:hypothetical protein
VEPLVVCGRALLKMRVVVWMRRSPFGGGRVFERCVPEHGVNAKPKRVFLASELEFTSLKRDFVECDVARANLQLESRDGEFAFMGAVSVVCRVVVALAASVIVGAVEFAGWQIALMQPGVAVEFAALFERSCARGSAFALRLVDDGDGVEDSH